MRKIVFAFILFAHLQGFTQNSYAKLDEKYGFKDLKFEMPQADFLKTIKNKPTKAAQVGTQDFQILDPKYLKVGDCTFSNVVASFFDNKLMSSTLLTNNSTDSDCLLGVLNELFGKGFQGNEFMEQYLWSGEKATAYYDLNEAEKSALVIISSTSLMDVRSEYEKGANKKNSKDF